MGVAPVLIKVVAPGAGLLVIWGRAWLKLLSLLEREVCCVQAALFSERFGNEYGER